MRHSPGSALPATLKTRPAEHQPELRRDVPKPAHLTNVGGLGHHLLSDEKLARAQGLEAGLAAWRSWSRWPAIRRSCPGSPRSAIESRPGELHKTPCSPGLPPYLLVSLSPCLRVSGVTPRSCKAPAPSRPAGALDINAVARAARSRAAEPHAPIGWPRRAWGTSGKGPVLSTP